MHTKIIIGFAIIVCITLGIVLGVTAGKSLEMKTTSDKTKASCLSSKAVKEGQCTMWNDGACSIGKQVSKLTCANPGLKESIGYLIGVGLCGLVASILGLVLIYKLIFGRHDDMRNMKFDGPK